MIMQRIKRKPLSEINVVPYIDVMLVLLVIFMITAPMLTQGVKIKLPQVKTSTISHQSSLPVIISIDKDGKYYLNDENQKNQSLSLENVLIRVLAETKIATQENKKKQILVRGDQSVAYGEVISLMALLKNSGITDVGLMTEMPQSKVSLK